MMNGQQNIKSPTNIAFIFFILDLFQKQFHTFIGPFYVSGMGLGGGGDRWEYIPVV
jgi:hypothetical protein